MKMKKIFLFFVIFSNLALAMEAPPSRKRGGQEPEDREPSKIAHVQQTGFQHLPADIKKYILSFLVTAPGATPLEQLLNAGRNIRNYLSSNKYLFSLQEDDDLQEEILTQLANRYAQGDLVAAAIALRTSYALDSLRAEDWINPLMPTPQADAYVPLFLQAIRSGDEQTVKFMVQLFGLFFFSSANRGGNDVALVRAAETGNMSIFRMLLDFGTLLPSFAVFVNQRDGAGQTPLLVAINHGHESIALRLLDCGEINPNIADVLLITPLFAVARQGLTHVVERLLHFPININQYDIGGYTPLMVAALNGHLDIVKLLLARPEIQVNMRSTDGRNNTALMAAYASTSPNKAAIIKLLVEHGAVR